eukprot:UN24869
MTFGKDPKKELYVSGIPATFSEQTFRDLFSSYATRGQIVASQFTKHVVGKQTGYGLLSFTDADDAQDAMNGLNGTLLGGELVKVVYNDGPPKYKSSQTNLYVEGLPLDWTNGDLKDLFKTYGEMTDCRVLINRKTEKTTGVGFVHFKEHDDAQKAIDGLSGTYAREGHPRSLVIRFAKVMGGSRNARGRGSRGGPGGYNNHQNSWRGRGRGHQGHFNQPYNPYHYDSFGGNPYEVPWYNRGGYGGYVPRGAYGRGQGSMSHGP